MNKSRGGRIKIISNGFFPAVVLFIAMMLLTHTTIGVVEYNSINNERERLVIEYEERTIIQLLKNRLRYTSPCGCEDEERDNSLICSILFMLFIVPYSFYILLLILFWGYLIIMNILEIILTITGLPFLRLAEEINCEWTNKTKILSSTKMISK